MPKQTKEQFDKVLNRATAQMKDEIAKREVITFRLDEQSLKRLQDLSVKEKKHIGALVREWVMERLEAEIQDNKSAKLAQSTNTQIKLIHKELEHMRHYLHALEKRVS